MKRIYLLITLLLVYVGQTSAINLSNNSYYHILEDINTFSSFFSRTENSVGETEALDFIEQRLLKNNINFKKYELKNSEIITSGSSTIDAIIPGKSGNEIFLIFPLNNRPDALPGRDGSANLASALFLATELKKMDLPQIVHIIFMGAELGDGSNYPLGTRDYLSNYYPDFNSAFFYFDFNSIPDEIIINHSGTRAISPLWILKKSINALNQSGIKYTSRSGINLVNRLGLNDNSSIIDNYFENDLPVISFKGIYSGFYTPKIEQVSALNTFFMKLTLKGGGLIPSNSDWDSHYLFIKIMNREIFINETNYVIFLLLLISIIIIYPFIADKRFKKYLKTILNHLWNIPVIFFIMFLLLWISTIIINIISQIQSYPRLWENLPFHFLTLKLSLSLFIFLLTLRFFKGIHFSKRGSFYSAAALVFIIMDFLILISIDIAFSYYLLPVLLFTFFFTIARNRWIKLIFLILSILVLLGGIINIFLLNVITIEKLVILSPVKGNLIITANMIPVALMIFRLQFLFHRNRKSKYLVMAGDIFLGILSIGLFIYLATVNPFTEDRKQTLQINENILLDKGTREISFSSPGSIGKLLYSSSSKIKEIKTKNRNYSIYEEQPLASPRIELKKVSFLNRSRYTITIDSKYKPHNITATLKGQENILLYNSNKHSNNIDEKTSNFLIETNPVMPYKLNFTLNQNFKGNILVKLYFTDYPLMVRNISENFSSVHNIIFEKKISIGDL